MTSHKLFAIVAGTLAISAALGLTTLSGTATATADAVQQIDRVPVALVKLTATKSGQLMSRDGKKILRVEEFDPTSLTVKVESPTQLLISVRKPSYSQMKITYEDGQTEQLVFVAGKSVEE